MVTKPPWSVFHRNSPQTLARATAFEADPGVLPLMRMLGPALRS